jgi:hypothetical protein
MNPTKVKYDYSPPDIQVIKLDKDISLILESPTGDPNGGDGWYTQNESFKNDIFKSDIG